MTNAYRHTKGPASVRLTARGDRRLRVGAWDTNAERGRGLLLMQEYASSWGGWPLGDGLLDRGAGKLLWFEVGAGLSGR